LDGISFASFTAHTAVSFFDELYPNHTNILSRTGLELVIGKG
jgi:hypothetical protein